MTGNQASEAHVLSICTILPATCYYDITSTAQRLLLQSDNISLDLPNSNISYPRQLQGPNSYVQIIVNILCTSSATVNSISPIFQTNNIGPVLIQIDPSNYGNIIATIPTIVSITNNNNGNINLNPVETNPIVLGTEDIGMIIGGICFIMICIYIVNTIYKYKKNKGSNKIAPDTPIPVSPVYPEPFSGSSSTTIPHSTSSWSNHTASSLCENCHTNFANDANYCTKCGSERLYVNCPVCNRPRNKKDIFCGYCGTKYQINSITPVHKL